LKKTRRVKRGITVRKAESFRLGKGKLAHAYRRTLTLLEIRNWGGGGARKRYPSVQTAAQKEKEGHKKEREKLAGVPKREEIPRE